MSSFLPLAVVVGVLFFWIYRRVVKSKHGDDFLKGRAININSSNEYLHRWVIDYVDIDGVLTSRTIQIRRIKPIRRQVIAWCELRSDLRTFNMDSMRQVADAESGRLIDLESWLSDYRKSRRNK